MKYVYTAFLLGYFLALTSCSSTPRTKWSDKNHQLAVYPYVLDEANTMELTNQFMQSGKWHVVDRFIGMRGITEEQDMIHVNKPGRFDPQFKYAHWGKLHSIGTLVVPFANCELVPPEDAYEKRACYLTVSLVDTSTGRTLLSVNGRGKWKPGAVFKEWQSMVEQIEERYPKYFPDRVEMEEETLRDYQHLSERLSKDPKTNN